MSNDRWPWNIWGLVATIESPFLALGAIISVADRGPGWFTGACVAIGAFLWALCALVEAGLISRRRWDLGA